MNNNKNIIETAVNIKSGNEQLDLIDLNQLVADFILLNTDKKLVNQAVNQVANDKYDYELNRLKDEKTRLIDSLKGETKRRSPLDL